MSHTLSADEVCGLLERAERAEREWAEARRDYERVSARLVSVAYQRDEARARLAALEPVLTAVLAWRPPLEDASQADIRLRNKIEAYIAKQEGEG